MRLLPVVAIVLALPSCQLRQAAPSAGLKRNVIACRSVDSVSALRQAGGGFQRAADAELASGRCRRFEAGHKVAPAPSERGQARFVDVASGLTFWIFSGA